MSPNLSAMRSGRIENSLRNRVKRKKNRVIRAVETNTRPVETSTSISSSSQFEELNGSSNSPPSARKGVTSVSSVRPFVTHSIACSFDSAYNDHLVYTKSYRL